MRLVYEPFFRYFGKKFGRIIQTENSSLVLPKAVIAWFEMVYLGSVSFRIILEYFFNMERVLVGRNRVIEGLVRLGGQRCV
jgi:hypothetical protein